MSRLFAEIPLPEFPYKSSHIIIDSCPYNSNVLHINVFSQSKKILLLEYHKNEKTPIRKEVIDTDCYSFEIIKKTEQICTF